MRRAALLLLLLAGCEGARQDMYDQPRYKTYAASKLFEDGSSARPLPEGSVVHAQGAFAGTSSGQVGEAEVVQRQKAEAAQQMPYTVDMQLLKRGQDRYQIYCLPCHSPLGDGDGLVVRRGFPAPPSYHIDRLREAPDRHLYDVISHGYGIMYPYGDRVEPADRWAIVAYIRALQLSQHAPLDSVPADARAALAGAAR